MTTKDERIAELEAALAQVTTVEPDSEVKSRNIIKAAPMGMHMYRLEPDGRLVFTGANPAADKMLGLDNSQFIGQTIEEAFPPLAETEIPERYRAAASEGKAWQTEQIAYEKGEIQGDFEVHAFQTSPGNMVATFLNITERKRTEAALQQSEEKHRALYASMKDGNALHEVIYNETGEAADYMILDVNPAYEAITGLTREQAIGQKATELYGASEPPYLDIYAKVAASGEPTSFEVEFEPMEKSFSISVFSPTKGQFATTFTDITEQKQAQESLRESEERYRMLFDRMFNGFALHQMLFDEQGKASDYLFLEVNEAFGSMTGLTADLAVGKRVLEIIPNLESHWLETYGQVVMTGNPIRFEDYAEPLDKHFEVFAFRPKEGQFATIFTDITERKKMEAKGERLQQELIKAQQQAIQELSTPIIPIMERIIVMPLVGSIDTMRARAITRALLAGISEQRAKVVILDITGVPIVDSGVANHLNKTIQAARLKGARTIVTGISDAVAETIVDLGIDWSGITTLSDLQTGLISALNSMGIELSR